MSTSYYFRNKGEYDNAISENSAIESKINKAIHDFEEKLTELKLLVEEEFIRGVKNSLGYQVFKEIPEGIFIGNVSHKHKLFRVNRHLFSTIEEMKNWYLNNKDTYVIVDEYDLEYTFDELLKEFTPTGTERTQGHFIDEYGFHWMNDKEYMYD